MPALPDLATRAVLARVRSLMAGLTPSEQAVAQLVLEAPLDVVHLSVDALAEKAQVSTTSVMRFCQSIGFEGFKDFKLLLAAETGRPVAVLSTAIDPHDSPLDIAKKVFQADMQAIADSLELLDEAALNQAIEALDQARRVEVYGIGSSVPIAMDAYYRLLRIGLPIALVTDSHMQAVSASQLKTGELALIISHTGRSSETLAAAKKAKEAGAKVLSISSFLSSPLVRLSDISLVTASAETAFRIEAMASRIAHLSVIDTLYVALAIKRFDEAAARLEHSTNTIEEKYSEG